MGITQPQQIAAIHLMDVKHLDFSDRRGKLNVDSEVVRGKPTLQSSRVECLIDRTLSMFNESVGLEGGSNAFVDAR